MSVAARLAGKPWNPIPIVQFGKPNFQPMDVTAWLDMVKIED